MDPRLPQRHAEMGRTMAQDGPEWIRAVRPGSAREKVFSGLPSDKCVHKARPVPRSSRKGFDGRARNMAPAYRWMGPRKKTAGVDAPRAHYRPPLNGSPISSEGERQEVCRVLLSSPLLHGIPANRMLDILAGVHNAHVQGVPHITRSDHGRHDTIFSQGGAATPGVFFVLDGQVRLTRRNTVPLMDRLQRKLFVINAFGIEENALRKPKSCEKEWELACLGPGNFLGLGGMLPGGHYVDTARPLHFAKLIFIPSEVLGSRLQDVKAAVLQHLEEAALSRERQFARITALFEPSEDGKDAAESDGLAERHKKNLDTGISQVKTPVVKAESEKRYFRRQNGDVAYAGPYAFKTGEVPQLNPDLVIKGNNRTAMHFLKVKDTFQKPREPGAGPDARLPPPCEFPAERVGKLYHRLWDNCTPSTWNLLLDMKTVHPESADSPSRPDTQIDASSPTSPLNDSKLDESGSTQLITSKVPVLDLYKTSLQTPWNGPRGSVSDRPVTEPGRSRSPRHSLVNLQGLAFLEGRDQIRPKTSRPMSSKLKTAWYPRSGRGIVSNPNFAIPPTYGSAVPPRPTVAWSGPPDRSNLKPSDYVTRTALSPCL